ncbi:MAG: hypothetical protein DWQ37_05625 [Planctomycetota bacterium]|nr:MAG: hypothetical protein DWQ37_05625 [Planctomycetota bacterium]
MPRFHRTLLLAALASALSSSGCTIQDIFRSTLGGVNSDRATMNKINAANEYSYPQVDGDRTVLRWPEEWKK